MKLQTKLLIMVIPLIVLPLITLGFLGHAKLEDMSSERILQEARILTEELGDSVTLMLQTAQANLELFSRSPLLQKYLLTADEAQRYTLLQPSLLSLFRNYQLAYPEYYEIRVILPDGYEDTRVTLHPIPNITEQEQQSTEFRQLQRSAPGSTLLTFQNNPDNHQTALYAGKSLWFRDPSMDPITAEPILRGYLIVTIDPHFIAHEVAEHKAGLSGYLLFTNANRQILFHNDSARIGEKISADLFSDLISSVEQDEVLNAEVNGERVLFLGHLLKDKFYLFVVIPQRDLLAASREMSQLVGYVTIIAILVTLTLVIFLLKRLLISRISKLAQAAKEIGQGNLSVPIETSPHDELGDLAQSFKEMADNVQKSQQQIERLAFYDSLTGLPNRVLFKQQLDYAIAHGERHNKPLALLFLDFDNFKWINDTLSHEVGDTFLQKMADRIANALRKEDMVVRGSGEDNIVARLGGDEFLVLVRDLRGTHDAGAVARRILNALAQPLSLAGYDINVSASIGITLWPDDGDKAEELIKTADIAMYEAKRRGKGGYQYYSSAMEDITARRLTLETRLQHALDTGQLLLYYQPQVEVVSGRIIGFEALLRWQDPEFGMITPNVFLPLAEETGLIMPITAWVLGEACRQAKQWQMNGLGDLSVSVNISGIDVERTNLSTIVAETLAETGLGAESLVLELTETCVMAAQDTVVPTLAGLKTQGVKIALDDFGTGYSSLNRLKQLPIDELKIDRSFLANLPVSEDDAAIVSMITAIAQTLHLKVTAEGVETQGMLEFVKAARCDYAQGFLFSTPVPASSIPSLLKRFAGVAGLTGSIGSN
ncbi:MAG: EAL domain-containing protein [Candidatus Competibacteraceae bacterium]|jgi:diguanylate cyclase (GGDEF)-like protein|nr:EAL domain-containing protein [Candidatus Competibacteraceae bacterium]